MHSIDWIILIVALSFIVIYGSLKTKGSKNVKEYILGNNETPWYMVGISVMATQASAITFLSTPGQAYHDGMGFVQFYFGLPLAMIVICVTFIPIYHKLKVYTAYEYLEQRFDLKTRSFAAILFLVQRGLSTGITIYAPSIILSTILGWNLTLLNIIIGILVIIYTVSGGTKAVNVTQKQQMFVIMGGMFVAFFLILSNLPQEVTFSNALKVAGINDKMKVVDFSLDLESRYTFWSGITGGFFLALSYFGTDQSQVGRYLSGKNVKESQLGLIFNGLLKVPMQFFILLVGVMVFVFFQFNSAPINFNPNGKKAVEKSEYAAQYASLEKQLEDIAQDKKDFTLQYAYQLNQNFENKTLQQKITALGLKEKDLREQAKELIKKADNTIETNDKDYVFIHFVLNYLPMGFVGLLLAIVFSAAMGSTASALNALASTTTIDIYKRNLKTPKSDMHFVKSTKWFTVLWGAIAIAFACYATLFENLIQFVNILGSVFYGTILGIFLVGFYFKFTKAQALFWGAVISQTSVFYIYYLDIIGYLWLNVIGAGLTIIVSAILQKTVFGRK
ncbi:MAG: sodium:solute symporter [Flavobacteriaceae bacterium]